MDLLAGWLLGCFFVCFVLEVRTVSHNFSCLLDLVLGTRKHVEFDWNQFALQVLLFIVSLPSLHIDIGRL